jgi:hypothetical protein
VNIHPQEIENLLVTHPAVMDSYSTSLACSSVM